MPAVAPRRRSPPRMEQRKLKSKAKLQGGFIKFQFQALRSRRFQRGFDGVNLHRLTRRARTRRRRLSARLLRLRLTTGVNVNERG